jgi:hypothetical protein
LTCLLEDAALQPAHSRRPVSTCHCRFAGEGDSTQLWRTLSVVRWSASAHNEGDLSSRITGGMGEGTGQRRARYWDALWRGVGSSACCSGRSARVAEVRHPGRSSVRCAASSPSPRRCQQPFQRRSSRSSPTSVASTRLASGALWVCAGAPATIRRGDAVEQRRRQALLMASGRAGRRRTLLLMPLPAAGCRWRPPPCGRHSRDRNDRFFTMSRASRFS